MLNRCTIQVLVYSVFILYILSFRLFIQDCTLHTIVFSRLLQKCFRILIKLGEKTIDHHVNMFVL